VFKLTTKGVVLAVKVYTLEHAKRVRQQVRVGAKVAFEQPRSAAAVQQQRWQQLMLPLLHHIQQLPGGGLSSPPSCRRRC
jgi:hypothetical protein